MTGELSKNFHGVDIGPLSNILAVKDYVKSVKILRDYVKSLKIILRDYIKSLNTSVII